jgi:hypothetical protein
MTTIGMKDDLCMHFSTRVPNTAHKPNPVGDGATPRAEYLFQGQAHKKIYPAKNMFML